MASSPVGLSLFVGVDIAAATVTAAWAAADEAVSTPRTYAQNPHGFAALHTAGYRVSVINPLQAHHFAKAQLGV